MHKILVLSSILSNAATGRNSRAKIARTIALLYLSPVLALTHPHPALAQTKFVTAGQIKPILTATKGNWIALRQYEGQDLLYFTHLLYWVTGVQTCALPIFNDWPLGSCDEDLPNPNVLAEDQKIYTAFPLGSVQTVTVRITYDDETTDENRYERKSVMIP